MLAIKGGEPINRKKFEWNSSIGAEERDAAVRVLESKVLSDYYGSPGDRFLGGKEVREFDKMWAEYFQVSHAMSVNSASSGLHCAVGALGIGPGDEVIVAPLSMAVSAVCVLAYGAIPIFADVEKDYFCLDPKSVEGLITDKTKAIIVVNLLGQPAALQEISSIAKAHDLKIIEDNAQAPGSLYDGNYTGTVGDLGVFSLNCHKAIQTGEGGVVVTDDDELALRVQLIRNHAESVVEGIEYENLVNMIGFNCRLTEIQAAIGKIQLSRLEDINQKKNELAQCLNERLGKFEFLKVPKVRQLCTHVYYLYGIRYRESVLGVPRDKFIEALNAEGYQASFGYVKPIYLLPLFQKKIAIGSNGWPFASSEKGREIKYEKGLCPVAERLHFSELFYPDLIRYKITAEDIDVFANAVEKVATHAGEL